MKAWIRRRYGRFIYGLHSLWSRGMIQALGSIIQRNMRKQEDVMKTGSLAILAFFAAASALPALADQATFIKKPKGLGGKLPCFTKAGSCRTNSADGPVALPGFSAHRKRRPQSEQFAVIIPAPIILGGGCCVRQVKGLVWGHRWCPPESRSRRRPPVIVPSRHGLRAASSSPLRRRRYS
jgi:hypothetical protein